MKLQLAEMNEGGDVSHKIGIDSQHRPKKAGLRSGANQDSCLGGESSKGSPRKPLGVVYKNL